MTTPSAVAGAAAILALAIAGWGRATIPTSTEPAAQSHSVGIAGADSSGPLRAALADSGEALPPGLTRAGGTLASTIADPSRVRPRRAAPGDLPLEDLLARPRPFSTPPRNARPSASHGSPPALELLDRAGRSGAPATAPPHQPA